MKTKLLQFLLLILLTPLTAKDRFELIYDHSFETRLASIVKLESSSAIASDIQGLIYIVDRGRHQLLQFHPDSMAIFSVGGFGQSLEEFDDPRDLSVTTLDVFVADYNNSRISRFDRELNALSELRSIQDPPFDFDRALSVAVSSQLDLFILEDGSKKIIKFDRFSSPTVTFGGIFETYGQLLDPQQIELDGKSRLFVSDPAQGAIVVFDYLGNYVRNLEHPDLTQPKALHWSNDKMLFAADSESANIFLFSESLSFIQSFTINTSGEAIIDITSWRDTSSKKQFLYILLPESCLRYEITAAPRH
ncbi:MAG: NHL repeat-containing protein [Calditrichota bacterium]